jgi:hypothetical protein
LSLLGFIIVTIFVLRRRKKKRSQKYETQDVDTISIESLPPDAVLPTYSEAVGEKEKKVEEAVALDVERDDGKKE